VFSWNYLGPPINAGADAPTSSLVPTAQVIQRVFDWCNTDGRGFCRNGTLQVIGVPGFNIKIPRESGAQTAEPFLVFSIQ
jgi:hypothetical protein